MLAHWKVGTRAGEPQTDSSQKENVDAHWKVGTRAGEPQTNSSQKENVDELFKAFAFSRCHMAHTYLLPSSSETTHQFHPPSRPQNG